MLRTLKLLNESKDATMLELRIMANHAADPRFAFLRERSPLHSYWKDLRAGKVEENEPKPGLNLAYGSDSEAE